MRPGGGVTRASAASAASNSMPHASRTPSTPSAFDALNVPARRVATSPRPHGVATDSAIPSRVLATCVAAMSALGETVGQHPLPAAARRVGERCGRTDRPH